MPTCFPVADADYAMRSERYKLLRHQGVEEFYDLVEDPYEHNDLLARGLTGGEEAHYRRLRDQIEMLRVSESSSGRFAD